MEINNAEKYWIGPHARKDFLAKIETEIQQYWESKNIFNVDATETNDTASNKYYVTTPPVVTYWGAYGELPLFRAEFIAGYQRLIGKNVLFSFGVTKSGIANLFERFSSWRNERAKGEQQETSDNTRLKAKIRRDGYLWIPDKLKELGIHDDEIETLTEERLAEVIIGRYKKQIRGLGFKVDLRRSFESWSSHYASFLKWKFTKLDLHKLLMVGNSYRRYSANQGYFLTSDQDLDRGIGEVPVKYVALKQLLLSPYPKILSEYEGHQPVYLLTGSTRTGIAAYGQTNIWVLPEDEYGLYEFKNNVLLICSAYAAKNLAHQGWSTEHGVVNCLKSFKGVELVGAKAQSQLSNHKEVYVWPSTKNDAFKWVHTGLIISCPSINYADCYLWRSIREDKDIRRACGLDDGQVLPFEALDLVTQPRGLLREVPMNTLRSSVQRGGLYDLDVFYEGQYIPLGVIEGLTVTNFGAILKEEEQKLVNDGHGIDYYSTATEVVLRTGEKIIVSMTPYSMVNYTDEDWVNRANACLEKLDLGDNERQLLGIEMRRTRMWDFARGRGLDIWKDYNADKIDMASASTLSPAFLTISHLISRYNIDPKELTYDVYEYIFGNTETIETMSIDKKVLDELRKEFAYWMPVDVEMLTNSNIRTVGLFSIFDHLELLGEDKGPKSYCQTAGRFSGMYRFNAERPAYFLQNYPADVARLVLSRVIDSTEDAITCEQSDCETGILQLTKEFSWIQQYYDSEKLSDSENTMEFPEKLFSAQINQAIIKTTEAFEMNKISVVVKEGFYQLMNYRDNYRSFCESAARPMNKALIHRYIRTLVILISPICPHIAEHTWLNILKEEDSILNAKWPVADPVDNEVLKISEYLTSVVSIAQSRKKVFFSKQVPFRHPGIVENAFIAVTNTYNGLYADALKVYCDYVSEFPNEYPLDERKIVQLMTRDPLTRAQKGKAISFLHSLKGRISWTPGSRFFITEVYEFDEKKVLEENKEYLASKFGVKKVTILDYIPEYAPEGVAQPYAPTVIFNDNPMPQQKE